MKFETMAELKAFNGEKGYKFFTKDAMRFFNSKIESTRPLKGRFFITSEMFSELAGRHYTLRMITIVGSIVTIGEFDKLPTKSAAKRLYKTLPEGIIEAIDFIKKNGCQDTKKYKAICEDPKNPHQKGFVYLKENYKKLGFTYYFE